LEGLAAPAAEVLHVVAEVGEVRLDDERAVPGLARLLVAAELVEEEALAPEELVVLGGDAERLVEGGDRVGGAVEAFQRGGAAREGRGVEGGEVARAVEERQRLVRAPAREEEVGEEVARGGVVPVARQESAQEPLGGLAISPGGPPHGEGA